MINKYFSKKKVKLSRAFFYILIVVITSYRYPNYKPERSNKIRPEFKIFLMKLI